MSKKEQARAKKGQKDHRFEQKRARKSEKRTDGMKGEREESGRVECSRGVGPGRKGPWWGGGPVQIGRASGLNSSHSGRARMR